MENSEVIQSEINWFKKILDLRLKIMAGDEEIVDPINTIAPPKMPENGSPYAAVVRKHKLGPAERLVLILSFVPHIQPSVLDPLLIRNQSLDRRFTEFGGLIGLSHGGFLPTGETAMFLLAGKEVVSRMPYIALFNHEQTLFRENILELNHQHLHEPWLSSALHLTPDYREQLITGRSYHPPYSSEFPAQLLTTTYTWDELVLDPQTREDVEDIIVWTSQQNVLMDDWNLDRRIKPGFRALFYGPPGTGKTLTACLLGKATGLPVYRIDLSKVVSKYIGETEKNLASLFDHAQNHDWILFFDEADSLFGKRTESRNANDRAANQQVSYLLQRIEDFPGTTILATNQRSNLDEAFGRRFQSMIHFGMPNPEQRLQLWQDCFKDKPYRLASDVDLRQLANDYELVGGSIINVLRYACIKAVIRQPPEIHAHDLIHAISREFQKEGRYIES